MTDKRDGGPAFPQPNADTQRHMGLEGMTLRQWYAGKAMSGPLMDQGDGTRMKCCSLCLPVRRRHDRP